MAIVLQSFEVYTAISGTSHALTKPSGVTSGDLLIIMITNDSVSDSDQFNAVSGWTKYTEDGDSTSDSHQAVYYRVSDGGEGATTTVTCAVSEYTAGWYCRFDGQSSTSPVYGLGSSVNQASGATITVPAMTTSGANSMAIALASVGNGNSHPFTIDSGTGWAGTVPTDQSIQEYASSASQAAVFMTKIVTSAGTSENIVYDNSQSSYGAIGFQFAIADALPAGEMSTEIDGVSTVDIILGGTVEFSTSIVIQTDVPFGGTPVYTHLTDHAAFTSTVTQSVTIPAGDDRMVMLHHAHWDSERVDADSSATYDGNAMTALRTASTSMTTYYYLLGTGAEETKNVVWTAGADGSQFQTNHFGHVTNIQQTTPTTYHDSERLASHPSPYEHDLTVTAHEDYFIQTFECASSHGSDFVKAAGSDDFTFQNYRSGTLSNSGYGTKGYAVAEASQTYIWDTQNASIPTQNVNQWEVASGGSVEMVVIVLVDSGGGPGPSRNRIWVISG